MLKKKKLRKYLNKRWNGIDGNLKRLQKGFDAESLHDLRLHSKKYSKSIKKLKNKIDKSVVTMGNKEIKEYYRKTITKLCIAFLWPLSEDALHENRKKIKNLIYPLKLFSENLNSDLDINVKYLDEVQDLIGQWHDFEMVLNLYMENSTGSTEHLLLVHEKQNLLDKIKISTESFSKKVFSKQ